MNPKLSFLLSSKQFNKYIQDVYPEYFDFLSQDNDVQLYFDKVDEIIINTDCYNLLLNHIIFHNVPLKKRFQRFINIKCLALGIKQIDLDNLPSYCNNLELQSILIIFIHYFFI